MECGVVFSGELASSRERQRQGIAHCEDGGRAGGRRESERAGLPVHGDDQQVVTEAGERGFPATADAEGRYAHALDCHDEVDQFLGLAARGDGYEEVVLRNDAHIPVYALDRVEKECRRTGARQSGGHLHPNDA